MTNSNSVYGIASALALGMAVNEAGEIDGDITKYGHFVCRSKEAPPSTSSIPKSERKRRTAKKKQAKRNKIRNRK